MKTAYLLAIVVFCDAIVLFFGLPLERATWNAIAHDRGNRHLLVVLLVGNVTLFWVCIAGFIATSIAASRGVRFAIRRFSKASGQPTPES